MAGVMRQRVGSGDMKRTRCLIFTFAMTWLASSAAFAADKIQTVLDSARPGPTILIVHTPGTNDVSGALAIKQISCWNLTKGKVVTAADQDITGAIEIVSPAAIVMFEVEKVGKDNSSPDTLAVRGMDSAALLKKLNTLLDHGTAPLRLAADQPAVQAVPATSAVIELSLFSKSGGATLGERIRLFRHAVHEVLTANGMTTSSPWTLIHPDSWKIKAAIYAGGGTSINKNLNGYPACLDRAATKIDYTYIGPAELAQPKMLDQFDVVIVGGGGASSEAKAMGETGAAAIKAFIKRGGGYVSSCAGTYLATCNYSWSLKIIDADTVDSEHWARGTGQVDIELTDEGRKILGDFKGRQSCRYANGPLLGKAGNSAGLAPYTVLAYFRSDMARGRNSPKGLMPGTPAIIAGEYGQGRVLCCSPHPEYTLALKSVIPRAVKWAAKRPVDR
jgi:putative intracellular protease/amidase